MNSSTEDTRKPRFSRPRKVIRRLVIERAREWWELLVLIVLVIPFLALCQVVGFAKMLLLNPRRMEICAALIGLGGGLAVGMGLVMPVFLPRVELLYEVWKEICGTATAVIVQGILQGVLISIVMLGLPAVFMVAAVYVVRSFSALWRRWQHDRLETDNFYRRRRLAILYQIAPPHWENGGTGESHGRRGAGG